MPIAIVRDVSQGAAAGRGPFVLVAAINQADARALSYGALQDAATMGPIWDGSRQPSASPGCRILRAIFPIGLIAGGAVQAGPVPAGIRSALLMAVDFGLTFRSQVSGRRCSARSFCAGKESKSAWGFLRPGLIAMPPALALAMLESMIAADGRLSAT